MEQYLPFTKEEMDAFQGRRYVVLPCFVPEAEAEAEAEAKAVVLPLASPPQPAEEATTEAGEKDEANSSKNEQQPEEQQAVLLGEANKSNHVGRETGPKANASANQTPPKKGFMMPQIKRLSWSNMRQLLESPIPDPVSLVHVMEGIRQSGVPAHFFFSEFHDPNHPNYIRFFHHTLPFLQKLALRLPELFPSPHSLPLLLPSYSSSCASSSSSSSYYVSELTLSQEQIACLMANGFFGTLWVAPEWFFSSSGDRVRFPDFDFKLLFAGGMGGRGISRCLMHYFDRIAEKMPEGKVTFRRKALHHPVRWEDSTKPFLPEGSISAFQRGTIEDSPAQLHADFANEYIGGGVLHGGCVQEEILFAIKTECMASMLFCAKMDPEEVIFIDGAERYSSYAGYGFNMRYAGDYIDATPRDSNGQIATSIVAMDAIVAFGGSQWSRHIVLRDLDKAYCAFFQWNSDKNKQESDEESEKEKEEPSETQQAGPETQKKEEEGNTIREKAVATGNWGCGGSFCDMLSSFCFLPFLFLLLPSTNEKNYINKLQKRLEETNHLSSSNRLLLRLKQEENCCTSPLERSMKVPH
ncbi:poly(ADP-ribose) glycohydrolase, variant 2 [Balamuthia mandrillaris]